MRGEELIEQFRESLPDQPPPPHSRWSLAGRIDSGVAVPLQADGDDLRIWLTKRPATLRHHAREVSFPGGRREPEDPSLLATALREFEEEVGVGRGAVEVLGPLAPVPTGTSTFLLHPFAITVPPDAVAEPSPDEVDDLVRLSLDAVLEGRVPFRVIDLGDHRSPIFDLGGRTGSVYGATAYILEDVIRRLATIEHRWLPEPDLLEEIPWN